MRRLGLAVVIVVGAGLLGPLPATAGTEPRAQRTVEDRNGDAIDARGDIDNWSVRHRTRVTFRLRTVRGVDPGESPAWLNTNTAVVWLVETDSRHPGYEFRVTLRQDRIPPYPPYLFAVVRDLQTNTARCGGSTFEDPVVPQWLPPNLYDVSVPRSCLGNPRLIRAAAQHIWDPPPRGGRQGVDRSPARGSSLPVAVG